MPKISRIKFRCKVAAGVRDTKKRRTDDNSVASTFPFDFIPAPSRRRRSDLGSKHKVASVANQAATIPAPSRRRRSDLGSKHNVASVANQAATKYGAEYLSELRFLRCGCCLREDSSSKFVELSKAKEASYLNYLQKMKTYYMGHLRRLDSTDYDKTFANAYEDFVDEVGIFGNSRYICSECYKDLRKVT